MSTQPPAGPTRPSRKPPTQRQAAPGRRADTPAVDLPAALGEQELQQLQDLMDSLPATLEPLDVVMIDGYLCGVLLQPQPVPAERWLALIPDVDGRAPPARFDLATMRALVLRRHAELDRAIAHRQWFDPWVYQLDDAASPSETVLPWVAGFATAVDAFTGLMDRHERELLEPLATLYRHLDADDLEDADELLAEIETLAPPETLAEAVEDLVRSVLLMADVSRPVAGALAKAPPLAVAARGATRRHPAREPGAQRAAAQGPAAKRRSGPGGPGNPGAPKGGRGPR